MTRTWEFCVGVVATAVDDLVGAEEARHRTRENAIAEACDWLAEQMEAAFGRNERLSLVLAHRALHGDKAFPSLEDDDG